MGRGCVVRCHPAQVSGVLNLIGRSYISSDGVVPVDKAWDAAPIDLCRDATPIDLCRDATPIDLYSDATPIDLYSDAAPIDSYSDAAPIDFCREKVSNHRHVHMDTLPIDRKPTPMVCVAIQRPTVYAGTQQLWTPPALRRPSAV